MNTQQHADCSHRYDETAAAITNQWQCQALGRQDAHVDPDIDKRLQPQPGSDADRQIGLEVTIRRCSAQSQLEYSPQERNEKSDQNERTKQAEFFA